IVTHSTATHSHRACYEYATIRYRECLCVALQLSSLLSLFFFNDTATTEIYTLSLHDALPISPQRRPGGSPGIPLRQGCAPFGTGDRKSTRLNSSHVAISYAVFCLKKKKKKKDKDDGDNTEVFESTMQLCRRYSYSISVVRVNE